MSLVQVRDCKTGADVRENFMRTKAVFDALKPPIKSPWQTRYEQLSVEYEATKAERDQYRALCEKLTLENQSCKAAYAEAQQSRVMDLSGPLTIEKCVRVTCDFYGVERYQVVSECRRQPFVQIRQVAALVARELTLKTFPELGRYFRRDHSTIVHGIEKITELRKTDDKLDGEIKTIIRKLVEANAAIQSRHDAGISAAVV